MKPILFANRAFGPVAGLADGPELVESRGTGDAAAGFLAPIGAGDAVAVVHIHLHIEDSIPVGAVEDRQGWILDQQDIGVVVIRDIGLTQPMTSILLADVDIGANHRILMRKRQISGR